MSQITLNQALRRLKIESLESTSQIKAQFRQLALQWHPDRNPDPKAAEVFRDLVEAYEFLLSRWAELNASVAEDETSEVTVRAEPEEVSEIFADLFGFSRDGRVVGYHEAEVLSLRLDQFCLGGQIRRRLRAYRLCSSCEGAGGSGR